MRIGSQKQQAFAFFQKKLPKTFGGQLLQRKRKSKRPLSTKSAIHLVIKSEKAKGNLSFVNHQSVIIKAISAISKKWNIKVHDQAVNFNHVHFVIQINSESDYRSWIVNSQLKLSDYFLSKLEIKLTQFFSLRPWTRILHWVEILKNAMEYLILNKMEVVGLRPTKKTKKAPPLRP